MIDLRCLCAVIATVFATACSHTPVSDSTPRSALPAGVDGYHCYRRQAFDSGHVEAWAHPNYRGSYENLAASWNLNELSQSAPDISLVWTQGEYIPPPGFLNASWVLPDFPPLGTQISLRLSSGEFIQNDFIDPQRWHEWAPGRADTRYGGFVQTTDQAFMEAFERAQWADVMVFDPDGVTLAYDRIDLSGLPEQLEAMRRLENEIIAAAASYEQACEPSEIEYH